MASALALRDLVEALGLPVRDTWLEILARTQQVPAPTAANKNDSLRVLLALFLECDLNSVGASRLPDFGVRLTLAYFDR